MTSIFNTSSGELRGLSRKELALRIRSEGCVFDLPPLVQVLLEKLEEYDPEDLEEAIDASVENAEKMEKKIDEARDLLDRLSAAFDEIFETSDEDEDEVKTQFLIRREDFDDIQTILDKARDVLDDLNPDDIVPDI